jgi:hypothetical protein
VAVFFAEKEKSKPCCSQNRLAVAEAGCNLVKSLFGIAFSALVMKLSQDKRINPAKHYAADTRLGESRGVGSEKINCPPAIWKSGRRAENRRAIVHRGSKQGLWVT